MSEPTFKLPASAEALLADFPMTEPDFEAQAKAIEARLASASGLSIAEDLFKAPDLAPESGEPAAPSSVRAASVPRGNFAEMARRSVQKKDDDAAQLAKELLAATAQNRRPNAEMVERVKAAGRATSTPLPVDSVEEPARPSGVVTRAEAPVAAAPAVKKAEPIHRGTIIGIAGTLVAIAACVALFMQQNAQPSPTASAIAAAHQRAEPTKPHAVLPTPDAPATKPSDVVSPESIAQAPVGAAAQAPTKAEAPKAGAAAAPASKPSAAPSAVAQAPVELEDDPPAATKPAPAEAKPEPEPQMRPAEGNSGSVPLTPSAGAVSTALGAVRASAQACLAGQTASVPATITFAPDGHVLRVNASGPAASCIQAALSKAHIAPFARESFNASTTVRPP